MLNVTLTMKIHEVFKRGVSYTSVNVSDIIRRQNSEGSISCANCQNPTTFLSMYSVCIQGDDSCKVRYESEQETNVLLCSPLRYILLEVLYCYELCLKYRAQTHFLLCRSLPLECVKVFKLKINTCFEYLFHMTHVILVAWWKTKQSAKNVKLSCCFLVLVY